MNLKKVIDYFTKNAEDSDNVRSISISMDAKSIRTAMRAPEESEKPAETTQLTNKEENNDNTTKQ